jgi:hypothetical protein
MSTTPYKGIILRPLLGPMDSRSNPEDAPANSFRFKLNMMVDDNDKLARGYGWERLLADASPYVNQDAHDQGDCFDTLPPREPITMLYEATNNLGIRRLIRGQQSSLAILSESTGDWTYIGRNFGGGTTATQLRWSVGQAGNTIIFTNNRDKPQSYSIGTLPAGCGDSAVNEIADLNTLDVTQAAVAASFNGCIFLMNVVQDGTRYTSRVRWSGVNNPLTWVPSVATVANFQDLPYTETILAARELQGNLVIFTDKSIYRCFVNGISFGFARVYTEPTNRDKCLVYPQSLVSDGNNLYWLGRDAFYQWNVYLAEPQQPEWLWRSSNLVINTLDTSCCSGPVGEYWPNLKTILWSWPKSGEGCLNFRTIQANLRINTADIIDHGFTVFANYRSDRRQTLDEWLDEYCTDDFLGLCANIGGKTIDDFCAECNQQQLFIGASAQDYSIKQLGTSYSRERCENAATGEGSFDAQGNYVPFVGEYVNDGYFSIVRGMFPLGNMDYEKSIRQFLMEPTVQDLLGDSNYWRLRIGTSYQARDANPYLKPLAFGYETDDFAPEWQAEFTTDGDSCEVLWHRMTDKEIRCPDDRTTAQYLAANVRPVKSENWLFLYSGRFCYFELSVIGKDELGQVVPPVGAVFTLSRFQVDAKVLSS